MPNPPTARELIERVARYIPANNLDRKDLRDRAEASFALALEALEKAEQALHGRATDFEQTAAFCAIRRALAAMDGVTHE